MKEIINLQIGQCGNQIGTKFWETIIQEHSLENNPIGQTSVYFNEIETNQYTPRGILVDPEAGPLENIKSKSIGKIFNPDNFISGKLGTGGNWAKGHYTEGNDIANSVIDIVRKEAELSGGWQGFQICHSLGGGTGAGLGTLLLYKITEEFPDKMISSFSVFPSKNISDNILESYNSILSLNNLIEDTNIVNIFDNEALYNICSKKLLINKPNYDDLNHLLGTVMSGVTSSLRFRNNINSDLRKICTNMVPFPRLHFFSIGFSPFTSLYSQNYRPASISEITQQIFSADCTLTSSDSVDNRLFLSAFAIYKGRTSLFEAENQIKHFKESNSSSFTSWLPDNIKTSVSEISTSTKLKLSSTFIGNCNIFSFVFKRIGKQFKSLFRRKAYLHWYTSEGLNELEFQEAESNMYDLQAEYNCFDNINSYQSFSSEEESRSLDFDSDEEY